MQYTTDGEDFMGHLVDVCLAQNPYTHGSRAMPPSLPRDMDLFRDIPGPGQVIVMNNREKAKLAHELLVELDDLRRKPLPSSPRELEQLKIGVAQMRERAIALGVPASVVSYLDGLLKKTQPGHVVIDMPPEDG